MAGNWGGGVGGETISKLENSDAPPVAAGLCYKYIFNIPLLLRGRGERYMDSTNQR